MTYNKVYRQMDGNINGMQRAGSENSHIYKIFMTYGCDFEIILIE